VGAPVKASHDTAVAYVIQALEATGCATRADFNVDAIVGVSHAIADSWDFETIEPEIFWRIVSGFMK
jgi:hypothetical protein